MAEYVHRRWLDWSSWAIVGVYLSAVATAFWRPLWVITMGLAYLGILTMLAGFLADRAYYRRMRREQER
jgi:branched-subunit amino acid ABC-type transport system permease component